MATLEIPPPPRSCPRCYQEVRITLDRATARCSRGHILRFNRDTGKWEVE
mgnify:FL=1